MSELNFKDVNKEVNTILLNGSWEYLADHNESFSVEDIKEKHEKENFAEMSVPSNWQLAGLNNYNGSVWFIKNFNFDRNDEAEDIKILKFCGIDYFADVWLNWHYLGHHEGYFQQFIFNINDVLKSGENILIVRVTSPLEEPYEVWPSKKKLIKGIFNHHDCRPGGTSYEYGQDQNTGGIWNDVFIQYGFPVYINYIKISSNVNHKTNEANLLFNIKYISSLQSTSKIPVEFNIISPSSEILNHKINLELFAGSNEINYSIKIENPEFWWCWDLGSPNLYKIQISSGFFEEQKLSCGIREVYMDEKEHFFINGKRLFLRGTNLIPEQFLSELSLEKISAIVKLIKEANINIVRVHAHVNRKELYDEFDKLGILVWQDFSLQWTYNNSAEFINNALTQVKDMVRQLYNYASIVIWCCHNEPGEQTYSLDPLLLQAVKNEDSQRIARASSNYEEHPYNGWYWGKKEDFASIPMGPLVTEFGAQALPDHSSLLKFIPDEELFPPNWERWKYHDFQIDQTFNIAKVKMGGSIESFVNNSQSYQAHLLQTAVDFYRRGKVNGITGIFQFMFIDCWPSITWSVVDYYLLPKQGYYTLKKVFQPLYISINLRQDQYFQGRKFLFDLYIINDLHTNHRSCKLNFYIDEKFYNKLNDISINSDDITFIGYESFDFVIPDDLHTGNHKMKIELIENISGSVLSFNNFNFLIVETIGS